MQDYKVIYYSQEDYDTFEQAVKMLEDKVKGYLEFGWKTAGGIAINHATLFQAIYYEGKKE